MLRRLVALLAAMPILLVLASCAPTGRPAEAPVELSIPPMGTASAASPETVPPKVESCHALILASTINKSSYGCIIDEKITKHQGILTYPCTGNGDAEAAFGEQLYAGSIHEGEVDLEAKTELEWPGDGCRWGTTAKITGRVVMGDKLAWSYRDYVVRGQACSGSCTATTSFAVRRTKEKPRPADDDDDD